jgi:hypothetical protein
MGEFLAPLIAPKISALRRERRDLSPGGTQAGPDSIVQKLLPRKMCVTILVAPRIYFIAVSVALFDIMHTHARRTDTLRSGDCEGRSTNAHASAHRIRLLPAYLFVFVKELQRWRILSSRSGSFFFRIGSERRTCGLSPTSLLSARPFTAVATCRASRAIHSIVTARFGWPARKCPGVMSESAIEVKIRFPFDGHNS